MHVIRAADYRRMPWKNGGGETAEIAIEPPAGALEAFAWRVSMARVDGDGPFSAFPGVERTLTVLEGAGIRLQIEGREAVELTPASAPYAFPADVPTSATLLAGPITDFNVMTRRGHARQRVHRETLSSRYLAMPGGPATLVFCLEGSLSASSATDTLTVGKRDTLWFGLDDGPVAMTPDGRATLLAVELLAA